MAKMVPAWDKRTGRKLPNEVPKSWLDKGIFPNLAGSPQGAASAARATTEQKKGA